MGPHAEAYTGSLTRRLGVLCILGLAFLAFALVAADKPDRPRKWPRPVKKALKSITGRELMRHAAYLASDDLEGRLAGSQGGHLAGEYIAREFERLGLEPLGDDGTYFQEFQLPQPGEFKARNIIGLLRGTDDKLKHHAIVLGAHYDHIGRGARRGLSRGRSGQIHNGADDNASGTSGLLEVVEAFVEKKVETRRSIIFMSFDGEELGLLGSQHFVAHATFPLDKIDCMLNIDMIARNKPREMYFGSMDKFSGLNRLLQQVAGQFRIELNPDGMDQYMQRSDQWSFIQKDIPACFLFGGMHIQYHTEHDDLELLNPVKFCAVASLMFLFAYQCAEFDGDFWDPAMKPPPPIPNPEDPSPLDDPPPAGPKPEEPKPEEPRPGAVSAPGRSLCSAYGVA